MAGDEVLMGPGRPSVASAGFGSLAGDGVGDPVLECAVGGGVGDPAFFGRGVGLGEPMAFGIGVGEPSLFGMGLGVGVLTGTCESLYGGGVGLGLNALAILPPRPPGGSPVSIFAGVGAGGVSCVLRCLTAARDTGVGLGVGVGVGAAEPRMAKPKPSDSMPQTSVTFRSDRINRC